MKTNRIVIALITLLMFLPLCAQQPEERDSVAVYGAISNHRTGKPEPFCTIQFLNEDRLVAGTVCDEEGFFVVAPLPVGIYTLKVLSLRPATRGYGLLITVGGCRVPSLYRTRQDATFPGCGVEGSIDHKRGRMSDKK